MTGIVLEYTTTRDGTLAGTGEMVTLPCDQVLVAIGQALGRRISPIRALRSKRADRRGCSRQDLVARVWAGGDCVAGGLDLTVAAVEDGKRAAHSIHEFLMSSANGKA